MYPAEFDIKDTTESNTSASYLDSLLSIGRDGQLRTSLYDKRDDVNSHIINFPFLSSNIPSSPAYDVYHLTDNTLCQGLFLLWLFFILRATRISYKFFEQVFVSERLKSSLRKLYGRYGISSNIIKPPSPKCYMSFWDMTIYSDILHWSDISWNRNLVNKLDLITDFDILLPDSRMFP